MSSFQPSTHIVVKIQQKMEADLELIDVECPKRVRQQISVPFIWESKPGTPRRDWISKPVSLISYPPPSPSKLVVSVPFQWEEEPGKPVTPLPPPPYDATKMDLLTESFCSWNPFSAGDNDYSSGFDLDNFNNPFVSGPTLPDIPITEEKDEALFLVPTLPNYPIIVEKDERLFKQSLKGEDSNWQENLDFLSETEEYSSAESTVTTQNGASSNGFDMELLFALSSPEFSFLGNLIAKNGDDKQRNVGRRELTLGELIILSRKISNRNKPQVVQKKNQSKELIKKILVTCF